MKDRIEIRKVFDEKGNEIIRFYLHCDLGVLWMFDKPFTIGIYKYFRGNRSVCELRSYRYSCNKKLNKLVERLPAYIRYVKQLAIEEMKYETAKVRNGPERDPDYDMAA